MMRNGRSPWTAVLVLALLGNASPHAQPQANTGTIRGVIVDARDGTPLEKVSVRVQATKQATLSASDGTFELDAVPAGRHELYVSSVDYVLIRRTIDVSAGALVEITIPISAGTGTYTETVNVTSAGAGRITRT